MSNRTFMAIAILIILGIATVYTFEYFTDGPIENFTEDVTGAADEAADEVTGSPDVDIDVE